MLERPYIRRWGYTQLAGGGPGAALASPGARGAQATSPRWFQGGFWYRPVQEAAASSSATWIGQLVTAGVTGLFINTTGYTPAVLHVKVGGNNKPTGFAYATVTAGSGGYTLADVPLSASLVTPYAYDGDEDNEMVFIDASNNIAYEVQGISPGLVTSPLGWNAGAASGGCRPFPLNGDGWVNQQNGFPIVSGTSQPNAAGLSPMAGGGCHLGGLIFYRELIQGLIPHALMCSIPSSLIYGPSNSGTYPGTVTNTACFVSPCTRSDGTGGSGTIPMGSRLHLKASVSIASLTSDPYQAAILTALQTYGAIINDSSGGSAITLYAPHVCSPMMSGLSYPSSILSGINGIVSTANMEITAPAPSPIYSS